MSRLRLDYQRRRLPELVRALAIARRLQARERWTRAQVEALQRRKLSRLVDHALAHSSFYRQHYGSLSAPASRCLRELPAVGRSELMDNFDAWVTDPRLKLSDLQAHLDDMKHDDDYYLGRYRVLTTGGSSGRKGVFVFDRREWALIVSLTLRWTNLLDTGPRLPRIKAATVAAGNPWHITYRVAVAVDVGLERILRLEATMPTDGLVDALNAFQPDWLHAYPSISAILAQEQLEGRLRIAPRVVSTSSELRTAEMTERIREAWSQEPFDCYGVTEVGLFGSDCDYHQGVHAFDDLFIFEVVDEEERPVPDGEVGHHVLVTNLFDYTQPLIRYRLDDMIGVSTERCPCGRPFPLLKTIEGRSDDLLRLPDGQGGQVNVHPMHFRSPLARDRAVKQYQVVQRNDEILLRVVPTAGADTQDMTDRLTGAVREKLQAAGADPPPLRVETVDAIERDREKMSKLKLVVSELEDRG